MYMVERETGRKGEPLRALVVDDEPIAREYLKLILSRIGEVEIVGECGDAVGCLQQVTTSVPDVVFLDIHLPDRSGMEVADALSKLSNPPQLVFVTGYDEYAISAFDVAAADYIMKPFDQARLEKTLLRVRARCQAPAATGSATSDLVAGRLAIRDRDGCKLVDADDVCFIRVENRKTCIYTADKSFASQFTLTELEERLKGRSFYRANEGCLVNLDCVQEVVYYGPRTYELMLSKPKDMFIPLSRSRAQKLREMLGF